MPFRVRCHNCQKIIYESEEIKTPDEILTIFSGRCPKCGVKLSPTPSNVKISTAGDK